MNLTTNLKLKTLVRSTALAGALAVAALAIAGTQGARPAGAQGTRPGATATCDWTGTWDTSFNKMHLQQSGNSVTGTYEWDGGRLLNANVQGDILQGNWVENGNQTGSFAFRINSTCDAFNGQWNYDSSPSSLRPWSGTRLTAAPTTPTAQPRIWTDAASYREGATMKICFSVPRNGDVVITGTTAAGYYYEVVDGFIARGEFCVQSTAGPGRGTECLDMQFFSTPGDFSTRHCFTVV
jgi:hypothetical protein